MRRHALVCLLFLAPLVEVAEASALAPGDLVVERARLVSQDAASSDWIGGAVDMDGNRMVVGARGNDDFGESTGSAYVFVRQGTTWVQEAKLTASNPTAGDEFGQAVAIHGDTVVVTAHRDGLAGFGAGTAYVFTRSGSTWTEEARFTGLETTQSDGFGWSADISGDTIVVGALWADEQGTTSGSAYVFVRSGTTWSQEAQLVPSDGGPDVRFGADVAIDGDTALIGTADQNFGAAGSAYVFVREGTSWTEQQRLSSGIANTEYGATVALSGDVAAVGDWAAPDFSTRFGAVYVYSRTDGAWTQEALLEPDAPAVGESLGRDVALDGDRLLVGTRSPEFGTLAGACHLYRRDGGAWTEVQRFTPQGLLERDRFGDQVAISGNQLVAGAPRYNLVGTGAAHAFEIFDGEAEPGTAFCFGTGCPCGNDDGSAGCVNSTGTGATLTAVGSASVTADDLILVASDAPGDNSGLFVLGGAPFAPITVGDGLVCTGGLFRFPPSQVTPTGDFTLQDPVATAPGDVFPVGSTRHFQAWTRDVLCGPPPAPCPSPCSGGSNLSNGYAVTMTP